MTIPSKRLLLFTAKLGYQTRSFEDAARKLGVQLVYVTDRCHQLEDPWGDQAIPVHFESPKAAAYAVMESLRGQDVAGIQSEEHTSELQSHHDLVCRLLLEKKKKKK